MFISIKEMVSKCLLCRKKIKNILIKMTGKCRCGNIYCSEHITNHNCNFDYKKLYEKEQENKLFVVKKAKVDKI